MTNNNWYKKGIGKKRRGHGLVAVSNDIMRARVFFNYAFKHGLVERPVIYGDAFKKPQPKLLRRERRKRGKKMFEAWQIHVMLAKAKPQLKAMILLGINCGFGNNDCATLTVNAVDFDNGTIEHPRPKTEVERRCRIWPETVQSLKVVLAKKKAASDLVFVTKYGSSWALKAKYRDCPITKETCKLLKEVGLRQVGLNFYALRHTYETVAGDSCDQVATDFTMGHAPKSDDMAAVYREKMSRKRLTKLARHVHHWLFNSRTLQQAAVYLKALDEKAAAAQ